MKKISLLIGNGINNIGKDNSWDNLIVELSKFCKVDFKITDEKKAHFPLLYEEIFLTAARKNKINEHDVKKFIVQKVSQIKENGLHSKILSIPAKNIITTNYDFSIEGVTPSKNNGIINEKIYSVFRHYIVNDKKIWHIHGDCLHPQSINLGFEHYGGQLQYIRNYVTTGTNYASPKISTLPFIKRLERNKLNDDSWLDLFFTTDVHIIGLTFDFVETDLWWPLTLRAREMIKKPKLIKNEIVYYIPKKFASAAKNKLDLFKATNVRVEIIDKIGEKFYNHVLNKIKIRL